MDTQAQAIIKAFGLENAPTIVLPTEEDVKRERMRLCGTYAARVNPSSGKFYHIKYRCGLWRDGCPLCLEERHNDFLRRFHAVEKELGDNLCIIQRSKNDMTKLLRKLRKGNPDLEYWRVPTTEGDLLFIDRFYTDIPSDIEPGDLDWLELCQTPERRKYSGSLGREIKDEEDEGESFVVGLDQITAESGAGDTLTQAANRALEKTADLKPEFDQDNIEQAIAARTQAYVDEIVAGGGKVTYRTPVRLKVSEKSYGDGWKDIGNIRLQWGELDTWRELRHD